MNGVGQSVGARTRFEGPEIRDMLSIGGIDVTIRCVHATSDG